MKRKIAAALSIMMVTASYATPFVHAEDKTVEGTGTAAYVDDSVITVVVPTDASLGFTLDPQGLVSLAESDEGEATKVDVDPYSGRILGNTALIFANKSLKDVTVKASFQAVTDADVISPGKSALSDAKSDTNSDKANLIFMAVPNKDAIQLSYADSEVEAGDESLEGIDSYSITDNSGVWAGSGVLFGTTAVETKSKIDAADFKFTEEDGEFSYVLNKDSKNSAAGFVIAGFCNPYYTGYDDLSVKVKAVYSFAASTKTERDTDTVDGTFAVISPTTLGGTPATKKVTTVGATETSNATVSYDDGWAMVSLPEGKELDETYAVADLKATGISDLTSTDYRGNYEVSFHGADLWIAPTALEYLLENSNSEGYVKVTVKDTDGKTYNAKITGE